MNIPMIKVRKICFSDALSGVLGLERMDGKQEFGFRQSVGNFTCK